MLRITYHANIIHDVKNRGIYQDFGGNNKWNSLHVNDAAKPVIDFLKKLVKEFAQHENENLKTLLYLLLHVSHPNETTNN